MNKRTKNWLIVIFTITLLTRLVLAFLTPNFTYDSYFHLRQVEHISETGLPLYDDPLSYGGRELRFLPLFHYFIAAFDFFLPLEFVAKVIPNLLLSLLPLIIYFTAMRITNNQTGSLFAAFISGFLPILYFTNTFSVESLFLPLVFLNIFAFLNIENKQYLRLYLLSFLLLSLTSPLTILVIIGQAVYLLLSLLEQKKIPRSEVEVILFSSFFYVWVQFLFFKNIFIAGGTFVWKNIPLQILQQYYPNFSLPEALLLVSVIPFIAGVFVVYQSLFKLRNTSSFLFISIVISTTIMAWLRLIPFKLSLSFFGITLAILFAPFYKDLSAYFRKTKFAKYNFLIPRIMIILIVLSTVFPAISTSLRQETPTDIEVENFKWFAENTPEDSGVLAILEEGHLVTYYSKRRNIVDDQFSLAPDVEERFQESNALFTTSLQTYAINVLNKYGIEYLIYTPYAREKLNNNNFNFLTGQCFKRLHNNTDPIKRYQAKCTLDNKLDELEQQENSELNETIDLTEGTTEETVERTQEIIEQETQ